MKPTFRQCAGVSLLSFLLLSSIAGEGIRDIRLPLRGLEYDSVSQKLYGTSAETNRLLEIDPLSGLVTASFDVGSVPSRIALAASRSLWIGLDGAGAVRRFNLETLTPEEPIIVLNGATITDIAPSPADPYTLAVALSVPGSGPVSYIIRNGQLLPDHAQLPNVALFGNFVYGTYSAALWKYEIGPNGFGSNIRANAVANGDVLVYDGMVYHPVGYFFRILDLQFQGVPFMSGQVALNRETDELFFLNPSGAFNRYNRLTRAHTGSAELGLLADPNLAMDLVVWGTNRAAFHNATNLFFLETDKLFQPADLSIIQSITNLSTHFGSEITINVTVSNKGPGLALDVVLTNYLEQLNGLERRYILRAVDDAPAAPWRDASFIARFVGPFAPGDTRTFSIRVLPKTPGPLTNRVMVMANNELFPADNTNAFTINIDEPADGLGQFQLAFVDAAYDRVHDRIVTHNGTALWSLDADGLQISEPGFHYPGVTRLAIASDGRAYFGPNDPGKGHGGFISQAPGNPEFISVAGALVDLEASPADPDLLAVSTTSGTSLYRRGSLFPRRATGSGHLGFSQDGTRLYIVNSESCSLGVWVIAPDGITLEKTIPNVSCSDFTSGNGLLLFESGLVFDPATGQKPSGAPLFVPPAFLTPNGNDGFDVMSRSNGVWVVRRFGKDGAGSYKQFAERQIGLIVDPVIEVFPAGNDRIAYRTGSVVGWADLPGDPSRIRVTRGRDGSNQLILRFTSIPGAEYQTETRSNLGSGQWAPVGSRLTGDGGMIIKPLPAPSDPRAYYRIVRL